MLDGFDLEVFEGKVYSSGCEGLLAVVAHCWGWHFSGRQCCQLRVVILWVTQPLVTAGEEVKQPAP